MSLPDEANTITGGCSCGAIRYRIAVPALKDRLLHPMSPPSENSRFPQALTCHCNDCRHTTSSATAITALDLAAPMLTVSAMSPSSESSIVSGRLVDVLADDFDIEKSDAERPPYLPAVDVLRATNEANSWVRFFHSTSCDEDHSRSFCGRCGSPLCYHLKLQPFFCHDGKMPDGWQDLFHIYVGTMDRQFLDKDWIVPDVEINFKLGTPFSKKVSASAVGLKHVPKMMEFSEEQGIVGEEELAKLGA